MPNLLSDPSFPMPMPPRAPKRARLRACSIFVPAVLALTLGGCSTFQNRDVDPITTEAISADEITDLSGADAIWGSRYAADPDDPLVALNYGTVLLAMGRFEQAVAVLRQATITHPEDRAIGAAYGKSLANTGALNEALTVIQRVQNPAQPDWRLLSAEAAILDQLNRPGEARRLYLQAIDIAPNDASLWSNLGMSYLLTGDLAQAEEYLRRAVALPNADSRVRQNLALAVGLQGRFAEAEQIARQELSLQQAEANIAFLREMLADQDTWTQLADQ